LKTIKTDGLVCAVDERKKCLKCVRRWERRFIGHPKNGSLLSAISRQGCQMVYF
jgi:hypothetical protein